MSNRVTKKDLDGVVKHLNEVTGNPTEPFTKLEDGAYKQNEGHFYAQSQLGGTRLEQLCKHGARDITPFRGTKYEVYQFVNAMLLGIMLQSNKSSDALYDEFEAHCKYSSHILNLGSS